MYTEKRFAIVPDGTPAAVDLTSASVHTFSYVFASQMLVNRLCLAIKTATVSNVSIVVTFRKRPTPGSAVGQTTLGTITIPTAIAAGKQYQLEISPTSMPPCSQLVAEVTTAAGGGGAAGAAYFGVECENDPEYYANQSNVTKVSA